MTLESKNTERLFSYGTLRTEAVQLSIYGRRIDCTPDALMGYRLTTAEVQDPNFLAHSGAVQRNLQYTGNESDVVEGAVLELTQEELEKTDAYEPVEYKRVQVRLKSGLDAWIYLTGP